MKGSHRIRLLEERVRRLVRRGEKDDASRVGREPLDDGASRGRRGCPDEKHGTDTLQRGVERFGRGQIARERPRRPPATPPLTAAA